MNVLLANGKPEAYRFIPQIEDVRVKIECACGCARFYFLDQASDKVMILANHVSSRPGGGESHLFVFAVGEKLGGIDAMHYNELGEMQQLPHESIFGTDFIY